MRPTTFDPRREDGAVLVVVALMMTALIGVGAIALDVAVLLQEHRELQNGADAAALAVAHDCALDGTSIAACSGPLGSADTTAEVFGNANAEDGASQAAVDLSEWSQRKVRVDMSTIQSGNDPGRLTLYFARIFGIQTGETSASAVATWGSPDPVTTPSLPIAVSMCEYTSTVTTLPGAETTILLHAGPSSDETASADGTTRVKAAGGAITPLVGAASEKANDKAEDKDKDPVDNEDPEPETCAVGPSGHDSDGEDALPAGFGWLDTHDGFCQALVTKPDDGWHVGEAPGNTPEKPCTPQLFKDEVLNQTIMVPIYVEVDGQGAKGDYTIAGLAAYKVTGYSLKFGAAGGIEAEPAGFNCGTQGAAATCIRGVFTTAVAKGSSTSSAATSFGASAVSLDD